jgi:hypothetical protein
VLLHLDRQCGFANDGKLKMKKSHIIAALAAAAVTLIAPISDSNGDESPQSKLEQFWELDQWQ